jgi:transcription elongation factor GreA
VVIVVVVGGFCCNDIIAGEAKQSCFCLFQKKFIIFVLSIMQRFSENLGRCFFFSLIKGGTMSSFQYVTKETLDQMKIDLQRMKGVDRPAASRAIAEAREKGDLKENAEYDAAKEAQGLLEAKIAALEGSLATIRVLDESNIDTSKVSILTKVTLTNINTKKQVTYQVVSEKEADLKAGKISISSPIGKGILGKLPGDTVEVQAPAGSIHLRIEKITA